MRMVVGNLLDNALKYGPADGPVDVSLDLSDNGATLVVADRGPGVPAGERQAIFRRFHRGGRRGDAAHQGDRTGLVPGGRNLGGDGRLGPCRGSPGRGGYLHGHIPHFLMSAPQKVVLMILDGWGIGSGDGSDAIATARTPFMDGLAEGAPHARLFTDGEHVGLPKGQMGNSEVGHLNIGAGRVVFQDLVRIDRAIADGTLEQNPVLQEAFAQARVEGRRLHFIGLVSDGGVHSHQDHLAALCAMSGRAGVPEVFVHAFTDGRDTDPKSGLGFLRKLEADIAGTPARVASVVGRYFAMDRDKRWERVRKAYDLLVRGAGTRFPSVEEAVAASYANGVTDEFIEPAVIVGPDGGPLATIRPNDVGDLLQLPHGPLPRDHPGPHPAGLPGAGHGTACAALRDHDRVRPDLPERAGGASQGRPADDARRGGLTCRQASGAHR